MCRQSIRDRDGRVWTGRLVDHLGLGLVGIDCDGRRHVGRKITLAAEVPDGTLFALVQAVAGDLVLSDGRGDLC